MIRGTNPDRVAAMSSVTVLSVGGSIVVPDGVDVPFLRELVALFRSHLEADAERRLVLVVGGGSAARAWQSAARTVREGLTSDELDRIGIAATRLNAEVVRTAFADLCTAPVFTDPADAGALTGRVVIGGGWKPGFSTDNVAVHAAQSVGASTLINLSNIRQIYTADPKIDSSARPLKSIRWEDLFAIVGDEWIPGANTPFDPVATRKAAELGMTVIAADGRDLENLRNLLAGNSFVGTTIAP